MNLTQTLWSVLDTTGLMSTAGTENLKWNLTMSFPQPAVVFSFFSSLHHSTWSYWKPEAVILLLQYSLLRRNHFCGWSCFSRCQDHTVPWRHTDTHMVSESSCKYFGPALTNDIHCHQCHAYCSCRLTECHWSWAFWLEDKKHSRIHWRLFFCLMARQNKQDCSQTCICGQLWYEGTKILHS